MYTNISIKTASIIHPRYHMCAYVHDGVCVCENNFACACVNVCGWLVCGRSKPFASCIFAGVAAGTAGTSESTGSGLDAMARCYSVEQLCEYLTSAEAHRTHRRCRGGLLSVMRHICSLAPALMVPTVGLCVMHACTGRIIGWR